MHHVTGLAHSLSAGYLSLCFEARLSCKYLPCCWFLRACVRVCVSIVVMTLRVTLLLCGWQLVHVCLGVVNRKVPCRGGRATKQVCCGTISLITWPSYQSLDGICLLYFTLLLLSSVSMLDTQTPYVTCMKRENSHSPVQCGPHPFYLVFTNSIVSIVIVEKNLMQSYLHC